jgi:hypothetical protein
MLIGFLVTTAWRMEATANKLNKQTQPSKVGSWAGSSQSLIIKDRHDENKQASDLNAFCGMIYLRKIECGNVEWIHRSDCIKCGELLHQLMYYQL